MTTKKPLYIPMNEEGLDDLFIWKHKIEKSLGMTSHMLYSAFINKHLKLGTVSFLDGSTKEVIPFSKVSLGDEAAIFYVPSTEEANKAFFTAMDNCEYDICRYPVAPPGPYDGDIESISFFSDNGSMRPVV